MMAISFTGTDNHTITTNRKHTVWASLIWQHRWSLSHNRIKKVCSLPRLIHHGFLAPREHCLTLRWRLGKPITVARLRLTTVHSYNMHFVNLQPFHCVTKWNGKFNWCGIITYVVYMWAKVQAIDLKFSQDLTHQKSLKSVNFWQSYLKKRWTFFGTQCINITFTNCQDTHTDRPWINGQPENIVSST